MLNNGTLEDRQQALREYLDSAEDRTAARDFITDCLDPVNDAPLLAWLDEDSPQNLQSQISNLKS